MNLITWFLDMSWYSQLFLLIIFPPYFYSLLFLFCYAISKGIFKAYFESKTRLELAKSINELSKDEMDELNVRLESKKESTD